VSADHGGGCPASGDVLRRSSLHASISQLNSPHPILPDRYDNVRSSVTASSCGYPNWKDRNGLAADRSPATIWSMTERIEVQRTIAAPAADIFAVLCDPQGHVAIDASGMLQDADGGPVQAVGDSFVVHMDREALNDYPLGKYDVTVTIRQFDKDRLIAWTILGQIRPQIGHVYGYRLEPVADGTLVTSFYDWSDIDQHWRDANIFPVISEGALRATLGILDRTVRRGYPQG